MNDSFIEGIAVCFAISFIADILSWLSYAVRIYLEKEIGKERK